VEDREREDEGREAHLDLVPCGALGASQALVQVEVPELEHCHHYQQEEQLEKVEGLDAEEPIRGSVHSLT